MQPYHEPIENPVLARNLATLRSLDPQLEDVAFILEQLTGLTKSFELKETGDNDHYTVYCITRARVSYLLLYVPRADPQAVLDVSAPMVAALREMIRLAALVLLLRLVGFAPGAVPHHAARLVELLERHDWRWTGLAELQLWVLVLAAVGTDDAFHRTSLARRVAVLMEELNLSWDGLAAALHKVAWADGVFDGRLRELKALV